MIGRPFFNINTGMQDRELTTNPAFSTGSLQVNSSSSLWGAELNKRVLLWAGCDFDVTGLVGFRYLNLKEQLRIEENSFLTQNLFAPGQVVPAFFAGDNIFTFDRFDTHNRFYGGQVGVNGEWRRGPWSLDARASSSPSASRIKPSTSTAASASTRATGAVQNFPGGLYALPNANIGHFAQTRFAVVPEVGVKLGYNITDNIRVHVGYDFLYWSSVVRPGDQIDTALDANRIPNFGGAFPPAQQPRPIVPFRTSSYWALGLNAGVEWRY